MTIFVGRFNISAIIFCFWLLTFATPLWASDYASGSDEVAAPSETAENRTLETNNDLELSAHPKERTNKLNIFNRRSIVLNYYKEICGDAQKASPRRGSNFEESKRCLCQSLTSILNLPDQLFKAISALPSEAPDNPTLRMTRGLFLYLNKNYNESKELLRTLYHFLEGKNLSSQEFQRVCQNAVSLLPFLRFKMSAAPLAAGVSSPSRATEKTLAAHFAAGNAYQQSYHLVTKLKMYKDAVKIYRGVAARYVKSGDFIIDAGAGTGAGTKAVMQHLEVKGIRPRVLLIDTSEAQLNEAINNGIPRNWTSVSDVRDMRLPNGNPLPPSSVDYLQSHSVVWGLSDIRTFARETHRVLKDGAILTIGTSDHITPQMQSAFDKELGAQAEAVYKTGEYPKNQSVNETANYRDFLKQKKDLTDSNRNITSQLLSPKSPSELTNLMEKEGFERIEGPFGIYPVEVADTSGTTQTQYMQYITVFRKRTGVMKQFHMAPVDSQDFHRELSKIAHQNPLKLKQRSLEELAQIKRENGRFFMSPDRKSGFGISGDGELFGVFNQSEQKGFVQSILASADELKINKVRCIDGFPVSNCSHYQSQGWVETNRISLNSENLPEVELTPEQKEQLHLVTFVRERRPPD